MDTELIILLLLSAAIVISLLSYVFATPKLTHAGAVVRRGAPGEFKYLFVSEKGGGDKLLLPKGKIEPGETAEKAALRELREEAGIVGNVIGDLGIHELTKWGFKKILVHFFLVVPTEPEGKSEEKRIRTWISYKDALKLKVSDSATAVIAEASKHV